LLQREKAAQLILVSVKPIRQGLEMACPALGRERRPVGKCALRRLDRGIDRGIIGDLCVSHDGTVGGIEDLE
jgi:hypothetical protein